MSTQRGRVIDKVFGVALLVVSVIMLPQMVPPREARGEGAKCANNTCKEILYYYNCANGNGVALETASCVMCSTPPNSVPGRCDGGTGDSCVDTGFPNKTAMGVDVTKSCDCQPNWDTIGGNVEATGNYTGTYSIDPSAAHIYTCRKPS